MLFTIGKKIGKFMLEYFGRRSEGIHWTHKNPASSNIFTLNISELWYWIGGTSSTIPAILTSFFPAN